MTIRSSLREHWHYPVLVFVLVCLPALVWFLLAQATVFRVTAYLLFFLGTVWAAFLCFYYHSEYYTVDAEGITHHVLRQTKRLHWDECRYIGIYQPTGITKHWFICSVDALFPTISANTLPYGISQETYANLPHHLQQEMRENYAPSVNTDNPKINQSTAFKFRFDLLPPATQEMLLSLCGEKRDFSQEQQPPHPLRTLVLRTPVKLQLMSLPLGVFLFMGIGLTLILIPNHTVAYGHDMSWIYPTLAIVSFLLAVLFVFVTITSLFDCIVIDNAGITEYGLKHCTNLPWTVCPCKQRFFHSAYGRAPSYTTFCFSTHHLTHAPTFRKDGVVVIPDEYLNESDYEHILRFCGTDLRQLTEG